MQEIQKPSSNKTDKILEVLTNYISMLEQSVDFQKITIKENLELISLQKNQIDENQSKIAEFNKLVNVKNKYEIRLERIKKATIELMENLCSQLSLSSEESEAWVNAITNIYKTPKNEIS